MYSHIYHHMGLSKGGVYIQVELIYTGGVYIQVELIDRCIPIYTVTWDYQRVEFIYRWSLEQVRLYIYIYIYI